MIMTDWRKILDHFWVFHLMLRAWKDHDEWKVIMQMRLANEPIGLLPPKSWLKNRWRSSYVRRVIPNWGDDRKTRAGAPFQNAAKPSSAYTYQPVMTSQSCDLISTQISDLLHTIHNSFVHSLSFSRLYLQSRFDDVSRCCQWSSRCTWWRHFQLMTSQRAIDLPAIVPASKRLGALTWPSGPASNCLVCE